MRRRLGQRRTQRSGARRRKTQDKGIESPGIKIRARELGPRETAQQLMRTRVDHELGVATQHKVLWKIWTRKASTPTVRRSRGRRMRASEMSPLARVERRRVAADDVAFGRNR